MDRLTFVPNDSLKFIHRAHVYFDSGPKFGVQVPPLEGRGR